MTGQTHMSVSRNALTALLRFLVDLLYNLFVQLCVQQLRRLRLT